MLLTIGRRGVADPFDVKVIRDVIKVPSVRSRELMDGYLWLRASQFQKDTGLEAIDILQKALTEGALKGVVLDLRNNPGGVLGASVDMAGALRRRTRGLYRRSTPPVQGAIRGQPGRSAAGCSRRSVDKRRISQRV